MQFDGVARSGMLFTLKIVPEDSQELNSCTMTSLYTSIWILTSLLEAMVKICVKPAPDDGVTVSKKSRDDKCYVNSSWDEYVCSKFYANPSNSCEDISLQTANVSFMVREEVKSGDYQSQ